MRNKIVYFFANILLLFIIAFAIGGCQDDFQPKPRGYFRIQLPEKEYVAFHPQDYPYSFLLPVYARVSKPGFLAEKYWINIDYPRFQARLHISYKPIHENLDTLLNDMHNMMNKHIPKANAIDEKMFINDELRIYGMAYDIKGPEAASPYQFYLTDSTQHFLRGALYFNFTPNNDSLKPIIEYLEKDIQKLIESTRWEK